ncbi:hypothetical protein PENSPDRAFT_734708 [Peniophora sp. CONT]|nr:hypothetical protein PENSPDRAFT_734708 [Peniophora sp. CONT]
MLLLICLSSCALSTNLALLPPADHRKMRSSTYTLLVLLVLSGMVRGQWNGCHKRLVNGAFNQTSAATAGALDNSGHPVDDVSKATAITYDFCKAHCPEFNTLWGVIDWSQFFTQISGWLVPWFALLSQLPYGATLDSDNVMSMLLALGSPVLAVYSLIFTALNRRYLAQSLSRITHPNIDRAYIVLDKLQQAPLCVDTHGTQTVRLNILPQDGPCWDRLKERALDVHTWTTVAVFQMAWVALSYGLSIANTFLGVSSGHKFKASGGDIGIIFLWLIPVVIGWLQVSPLSYHTRLRDSAGELTFVTTDVSTSPEEGVPYPALFLNYSNEPALHDLQATPPIFNYSRFRSWSRCVNLVTVAFHTSTVRKGNQGPLGTEVQSPGNAENEVGGEYTQGVVERTTRPRVDPGFVHRFIHSSLIALFVQWGTSGAAILANIYYPPRGLGCHSSPWLLYAWNSTIIWIIMTSSVVTGHATLTIVLRRAGKTLAAINALFVIVISLLNSLNLDRTCYCGSGRLFLGQRAYFVLSLTKAEIDAVNAAWVGAVVASLVTALLFGGSNGSKWAQVGREQQSIPCKGPVVHRYRCNRPARAVQQRVRVYTSTRAQHYLTILPLECTSKQRQAPTTMFHSLGSDKAAVKKSTIQDLPIELLWSIFAECGLSAPLSFSDEPPIAFAISQVSRLWHQAALQAPELWTTISSRLSETTVLLWLERSRGLPVRVLLDLPENPLSTGFCVKHVLEPCIARVSLLSVRGVYHNRVIDTLRRRVQDGLLTQLQALHLHPLGQNSSREARNRAYVVELRDIPLQRLFISSGVRLNPTTLRRINVQDLEIGPGDETVRMQTPLALVLSSLFGVTTVRTLRIDARGAYDARQPHVIREIIPCSYLERLYLAGDMRFCKVVLDRLRCPPLHTCGLSFTWSTKTPDMDSLHEGLVRALSQRIDRRPRSLIIRIHPRRIVFLAFDEPFMQPGLPTRLPDCLPPTAADATFALEVHCGPTEGSTSARITIELLLELVQYRMLSTLDELFIISSSPSEVLPSRVLTTFRNVATIVAHTPREMVRDSDILDVPWSFDMQVQGDVLHPEQPVMVSTIRDPTTGLSESKIIEEEMAKKIVTAIDDMDIRVAMWGRRFGESLPVW